MLPENYTKTCCGCTYETIGKILVGLGIVNCIVVLYLFCNDGYIELWGELNIETAAQLGTFIGGTSGPLWALAGVFFFYATLKMQTYQISLQRKSLRKQRDDSKKQIQILDQQAFETSFFSIIKRVNEISYIIHPYLFDFLLCDSTRLEHNKSGVSYRSDPDKYQRIVNYLKNVDNYNEAIVFRDPDYFDESIKPYKDGKKLEHPEQYTLYNNFFLAFEELLTFRRNKKRYFKLLVYSCPPPCLRFLYTYAYIRNGKELEMISLSELPVPEEALYHPRHISKFQN